MTRMIVGVLMAAVLLGLGYGVGRLDRTELRLVSPGLPGDDRLEQAWESFLGSQRESLELLRGSEFYSDDQERAEAYQALIQDVADASSALASAEAAGLSLAGVLPASDKPATAPNTTAQDLGQLASHLLRNTENRLHRSQQALTAARNGIAPVETEGGWQIGLGHWELSNDQALLIQFSGEQADGASLALGNIWSMELEPRVDRSVSATLNCGFDGSCAGILSHRNPGLPGWLNTSGHRRGILVLRWPAGVEPPTVTLTKFDELAASLVDELVADRILTNARVYTLDWPDPGGDGQLSPEAPYSLGWRPDAEAVALRGGDILAVGSVADVAMWRGDSTEVLDLAGATVLPGLVDSHTHVFQLGLSLSRVSLYDVDTEAEAVARIADHARSVPAGQWIVGQGWDEGEWADRYPDKRLLTEAVPDHPVFMRSLHSFAGWANQMALDHAGVSADTPVPEGGEMRLDATGKPSGLFLNRAVPLIEAAIPPATVDEMRRNVLLALNQMAADGYVTVHDAGLNGREMAVLEMLEFEAALPVRVYAMLSVRDESLAGRWLSRGPDRDADSFLVTRSVKAFYDGALGSRGARLLEDYSDRPGHRGVSGANYGFNEALTAELMRAGFQVGIHAIGDAGNRETLGFLERVAQGDGRQLQARHRIEHAQVFHADDMAQPARLGVILSMQPPHAVEDKDWAEQRLGPRRIQGAYAWRELRRQGSTLIFSADNPGSDHSIFYGIHAGLTRRDKQRLPGEGWHIDQALNIDEVMRAYTRWAAYAAFREQETGIVRPGLWADLTVMDIDPFTLSEDDPGAILDGRILLSIVAGEVVADNRR
jgi:predicted amidohydrolase YtcJ